ncbi:hypothetical protein C8Q76DRAFT_722398 [Earliella scabrosa]|nr:hypothetical protein C8Q76DRAFT_722398 [Earliella scabrosa]
MRPRATVLRCAAIAAWTFIMTVRRCPPHSIVVIIMSGPSVPVARVVLVVTPPPLVVPPVVVVAVAVVGHAPAVVSVVPVAGAGLVSSHVVVVA